MAWVRQYSAPNVVSDRKLKALIFYTINLLLYKKGHSAFLSPSLGGLGAMYTVHLRLIQKCIIDFLLVITELFSLSVTADEVRANIDWKSPFLKGWVTLAQFQVEGNVSNEPFVHG